LAGKIHNEPDGLIIMKPRFELLPKDYLRIGVEDEPWHATMPVTRRVPKAGTLTLKLPKHKTPKNGTPVFLIDRRETELLYLLAEWRAYLDLQPGRPSKPVSETPKLPRPLSAVKTRLDMQLQAAVPQGKQTRQTRGFLTALWLSPKSAAISRTVVSRIVWWLPPVVWPDEEAPLQRMIQKLLRDGAHQFVCNSLGQQNFFYDAAGSAIARKNLELLAGPFCNTANAAALGVLKNLGFAGALVSPELAAEDILALPAQSPLPLGLVISGFWPVGISRFGLLGVKENSPFYSPKGEAFWVKRYGGNVWLYPGWPLDLTARRAALQAAGYSFFVHVVEYPPQDMPPVHRQGMFNYDGALL
jgi:putative protease